MFGEVVPIFRYAPVVREDNEKLNDLDEIDFLQLVSDAVNAGTLTEAEGREMVIREEVLNSIR